ncbi:MAG: hypothetical protein V4701_07885 [Pseudomonadota bacterium]
MIHLKIEKFDGRTVAVIDDATLASLRASLGDTLAFDESAVEVISEADETERQLALAREVMTDYRETLDALAR